MARRSSSFSFPPCVTHATSGREALDVLRLRHQQSLGHEQGEIGIHVSRRLEAGVELALDQLPDGVAVRANDHAALHGRIVGQLRAADDVEVPAAEVLGLRGDLGGAGVVRTGCCCLLIDVLRERGDRPRESSSVDRPAPESPSGGALHGSLTPQRGPGHEVPDERDRCPPPVGRRTADARRASTAALAAAVADTAWDEAFGIAHEAGPIEHDARQRPRRLTAPSRHQRRGVVDHRTERRVDERAAHGGRGACAEHEALEQRIARQAVRAVDAGARDFAGREQAGQRRAAVEVGRRHRRTCSAPPGSPAADRGRGRAPPAGRRRQSSEIARGRHLRVEVTERQQDSHGRFATARARWPSRPRRAARAPRPDRSGP